MPAFKKMQRAQGQGPAAFRREAQRAEIAEKEDAESAAAVKEAVKARRKKAREGVPLRELVVGAEMRGEVQNIVRHGVFVDVGATRDGLVHIRDMSVDFVYDPQDIVRAGDNVPVWVKYVNPVTNTLGLTMVKPRGNVADRVPVSDIVIGQRYEGTVERVTNYGAYVDIGADRLAFLHVAALWGRRPRETLDTLRIGRPIWVNVDDVDEIRSHIRLRARGRADTILEAEGELGELAVVASPLDVDDVEVDRPEIAPRVVLARPGEDTEEDAASDTETDDSEDNQDDWADADLVSSEIEEVAHMFSVDTEFVGMDPIKGSPSGKQE